MAKTPKLKANSSANPRSRASKRASSPSLNLDKSLKSVPRQEDATPILHSTTGAGITKPRRARPRAKTRNQRLRQEKGVGRAEVVLERLEKKVEESKAREARRGNRKQGWEEVNGLSRRARARARKEAELLKDGDKAVDVDGWEDEDGVEDAKMEGVDALPKAVEEKLVVEDRIPLANGADNEDSIT